MILTLKLYFLSEPYKPLPKSASVEAIVCKVDDLKDGE
jgi:hypothetical protein